MTAFFMTLLILVLIVSKFEEYGWYFYIFFYIIGILAFLKIINGNANPSYKIAWIVPVLTIPIFGTLIYVIFGNKINKKEKLLENKTKLKQTLVQNDDVIKQITDEILKAVYSKQINIQEHLVNELLVNEVEYQALGRQRRIMQVQLVLRFFSDFSCFLGTNLLKVKVSNLFIKENSSLNESKFITVKDNAYRAGCLAAEVLPILDDRTKNYQKHFITGFFSSLIYIMENVNINSQSLYSFSKESNEVICQVLAFLDFLEK